MNEVSAEQVTPVTAPLTGDVAQVNPVAQTTTTTGLGLSEEFANEPSLRDFKDINALAKSYVSAQRMLGNSIRIPGEDASEEARKAFYDKVTSLPNIMKFDENDPAAVFNRLGRPETVDGYKLETAASLDPTITSTFLQEAHKAGLTNRQVNAVVGFQEKMIQTQQAQIAQAVEQNIAVLKEKFGPEFNNRVALAKNAVNAWSEKYPQLADLFNNDPIASSNPGIVAIMAELGKMGMETGTIQAIGLTNGHGMSSEEAKQTISEIQNNKAHPYHNNKMPGHKEAVDKVNKLYQIAYSQ